MGDINIAYSWMVERANNPNVGYSMDFRDGAAHTRASVQGYFYHASDYDTDFNYVGEGETIQYYDCSSAIYYALREAGYDVVNVYGTEAWATGGMDAALTALGFTKDTTGAHLLPGDICLNSHHTAMIYEECSAANLSIVHAAGRHQISNDSADPLPDQFKISGYNSGFNAFYRAPDSQGATVLTKDLSIYVVAAMCGNFWKESAGINPGCWEWSATQRTWTALNEGYGLGQWTNTDEDTHGRLYKLYMYLTENNWKTYSGDGQTDYIIDEKVWHTYNEYQSRWGVNSVEEFLNLDWTDLDNLTECWMDCFEGLQNDSLAERQERARIYFDYITEHKDDESITKWYYDTSTHAYLSDEKAANNAVMMYRRLYDRYNEFGYPSNTDQWGGDGQSANSGQKETTSQERTDFMDLLYALLGGNGSNGNNEILKILSRRGK